MPDCCYDEPPVGGSTGADIPSCGCRNRALRIVAPGKSKDRRARRLLTGTHITRNALFYKDDRMKVIVLVKATPSSEAGVMPTAGLLADMGRFNEELRKAGVLLAGEGLRPSRRGKRVRFSGGTRAITDGPFTETKELVAGFWLWQVKSIEEALEWVKRCPNPMPEDSEIEIRPLYEAADFAA
jgi:hypothetical protein